MNRPTAPIAKPDLDLPPSECRLGYPASQVEDILGDNLSDFNNWMRGQTRSLCEGRRYNHETGEYEESCDGVAHGGVTYPWDVERYLLGLPIID